MTGTAIYIRMKIRALGCCPASVVIWGGMNRICMPAREHAAIPGAINDTGFYSFKGRHKIIGNGGGCPLIAAEDFQGARGDH